jgi:lysophospholipase L1-like esterase
VQASATVDGSTVQQGRAVTANQSRVPPSQTAPIKDESMTGVAQGQTVQAGSVVSGIYVAMGDSVAAGAGLPALPNATATDESCDRSPQAYPYLIAERLQTQLVHTACSGAKTDEGIYGNQVRQGVSVPPQLDAAFAGGAPQVMTVTIGANDVRWTQFIRQCYVTRCGLAVDNARMKIYRADLRIELTRMLAGIEANGQGNPPRVLMSGYYSPVATVDCFTGDRITSAEAAWLTQQTANLNQAIRSVVPLFDFAEFVPLDFTGHEVCSNDPWVQGLEAEAPIHPTAAGHSAIAESFLGAMGR